MGAEQLSFDVGPPAVRRRKTLFFAVLPDPITARTVTEFAAKLCAEHGLSGPIIPPGRLHISLNRVLPYNIDPEADVSAALRAAAMVDAAPFDVTFDRAGSLGGREERPVALWCRDGVPSLLSLERSIGAALDHVGLWHGVRAAPMLHMTLLYDRKTIATAALEKPIRLQVEDFVLIQSLVGQRRHVHRGRWRLGR